MTRPVQEISERDLRDGQHRNPTRHPRWFTTAYLHHPAELAGELTEAGFETVEVLAIEGPADWLPDLDDWLGDPSRRELISRALRLIEREPSLLGASPHVLAVGRRGT